MAKVICAGIFDFSAIALAAGSSCNETIIYDGAHLIVTDVSQEALELAFLKYDHAAAIALEKREQFKAKRAEVVSRIKVESSLGRVFDGGEVDTSRMLKPIAVLKEKPEGATWLWVLADNTATQVALPEFLEVLERAGREQTRLWLAP